MLGSPPQAGVPYLLLKSSKPKAALGTVAFLPEKHGPSFKELAAGAAERSLTQGRGKESQPCTTCESCFWGKSG